MKAPEEVVLAFDPEEAGVASFTSETAKIIWCCIRKQHIVDQHFDSQVFGFAEYLDEVQPRSYSEFKELVYRSELAKFGTIMGQNRRICRLLDDEFWTGVWNYISGHSKLKIKISIPIKE